MTAQDKEIEIKRWEANQKKWAARNQRWNEWKKANPQAAAQHKATKNV
jgi:hypothetical protein